MAKHALEEIFSLCVALTVQGQSIENTDVDQTSVVVPATTIPLERRGEARTEYRCKCSYDMLSAVQKESVLIDHGVAFALNRSAEGMLLLMGQAPRVKQLIEVYIPRSRWSRTANVFEARWARPVQVESLGHLYLVGCRRTFGPCHYLSF